MSCRGLQEMQEIHSPAAKMPVQCRGPEKKDPGSFTGCRRQLKEVGKSGKNEDEADYFGEVAKSAGVAPPVEDVLKD